MVPARWHDYESAAAMWTVVLACWHDDECLLAGRTSVLARWCDDESAAGWMMVPRHHWLALARACKGGGGGADDWPPPQMGHCSYTSSLRQTSYCLEIAL